MAVVLEGGLAVVVGLMIPKILADSPKKQASCRSRNRPGGRVPSGAESRPTTAHASWVDLLQPHRARLCAGYFILMIGLYGWESVPVLTSQGFPVAQTGWMNASLRDCHGRHGAGSRQSDSSGERQWHWCWHFWRRSRHVHCIRHPGGFGQRGWIFDCGVGICVAMPLFWVAATEHLGENGRRNCSDKRRLAASADSLVRSGWDGWSDHTHLLVCRIAGSGDHAGPGCGVDASIKPTHSVGDVV